MHSHAWAWKRGKFEPNAEIGEKGTLCKGLKILCIPTLEHGNEKTRDAGAWERGKICEKAKS